MTRRNQSPVCHACLASWEAPENSQLTPPNPRAHGSSLSALSAASLHALRYTGRCSRRSPFPAAQFFSKGKPQGQVSCSSTGFTCHMTNPWVTFSKCCLKHMLPMSSSPVTQGVDEGKIHTQQNLKRLHLATGKPRNTPALM